MAHIIASIVFALLAAGGLHAQDAQVYTLPAGSTVVMPAQPNINLENSNRVVNNVNNGTSGEEPLVINNVIPAETTSTDTRQTTATVAASTPTASVSTPSVVVNTAGTTTTTGTTGTTATTGTTGTGVTWQWRMVPLGAALGLGSGLGLTSGLGLGGVMIG